LIFEIISVMGVDIKERITYSDTLKPERKSIRAESSPLNFLK
jgi:hypothetical protein